MEIAVVSLEKTANISKEISDISKLLNGKLSYGIRFISFENDFPFDICDEFSKLNITPIFTWEFNFPTTDGDNRRNCSQNETHLDDLLEGVFDKYIDEFASQAKLWNKTIYIRLFHEFNADWYTWGGKKNGGPDGGPEKVKQCWKYIVDKFRVIGADNVKWIWCPHEPSTQVSLEDWNKISNYWPGQEYVDLLGIDGFNFYPQNPEREKPILRTFESLFSNTYKEIISLSDKPIFIMTGSAEFSYKSDIYCKSEWINDAFDKIKNVYKRITIVGWFHFKFNGNADWRIDSSEKSLQAFRNNI
jgi:hypothetical protein